MIGRVALRALRIFCEFLLIIGTIVGLVALLLYAMTWVDHRLHWGGVGIAIMTILLILAGFSIAVAIAAEG